jgi:hypothetical protein
MAPPANQFPKLLPKPPASTTEGAIAQLPAPSRALSQHALVTFSRAPSSRASSSRAPSSQPATKQNENATTGAPANVFSHEQVIISLTNLQNSLAVVQNGLNDLLNTYMVHTASVLAGGDGDLDKLQIPAAITDIANAAMEAVSSAANGINQVASATNPADVAAADGKNKKRKREKKEKDPNAPKKPLTAAFLYAQEARPIVRKDLEAALSEGDVLEKNAVNLETTKRWNALPEEEKNVRLASCGSIAHQLTSL